MNTFLDFIHVAGNALLHSFRTAALCWLAVGLAVAVLIIRGVTKKKKGKNQDNNYCLEGMCLGMCFGTAIAAALGNNTGMGISLGMLVGLTIGMLIPKQTRDANK